MYSYRGTIPGVMCVRDLYIYIYMYPGWSARKKTILARDRSWYAGWVDGALANFVAKTARWAPTLGEVAWLGPKPQGLVLT